MQNSALNAQLANTQEAARKKDCAIMFPDFFKKSASVVIWQTEKQNRICKKANIFDFWVEKLYPTVARF
jgi:hypothetical protein